MIKLIKPQKTKLKRKEEELEKNSKPMIKLKIVVLKKKLKRNK